MLNEDKKESLESKILASEYKESCIKDIQETYLNNVTEGLEDNIDDSSTKADLISQTDDISSQATSKTEST